MPIRSGYTTAIIFRTFSAGESDKVVHALNESGEKVVAFAKKVQSPHSRKVHAIDLLNLVRMQLSEGKDMQLITEIQLVDSFSWIKSSYELLLLGQCLCEVVQIFAVEGQEEPGYYRNFFALLSTMKLTTPSLALSAFILRLLYISGQLPELGKDSISGKELEIESARALVDRPGFTNEQVSGEVLPARVLKTQKFMLQHNFATIDRIDMKSNDQLRLLLTVVGWLQAISQKELLTIPQFISFVSA